MIRSDPGRGYEWRSKLQGQSHRCSVNPCPLCLRWRVQWKSAHTLPSWNWLLFSVEEKKKRFGVKYERKEFVCKPVFLHLLIINYEAIQFQFQVISGNFIQKNIQTQVFKDSKHLHKPWYAQIYLKCTLNVSVPHKKPNWVKSLHVP